MYTTNLSGETGKKIVDFYWKEIWDSFIKGDTHAFELIYNKHVDLLFNYGLKMTRNVDLIEDAIQDLFLYILARKENLTSPQYIQYYLLKAFKRILLARIREEGSFSSNPLGVDFSINYTMEFGELDDQKSKEKKLQLIEQLIEQLDPRKKEILFLKFYSGLSYDEIGKLVGIQSDSAKKLVYRVVSSLREVIQKKRLELLSVFCRH
jgi:RNA polymerase sigma factor (sigma-70 family)